MKALSVTRPWSWLILHGGKGGDSKGGVGVENRVWQTTYRGPLVVHGAMSKDVRAVEPFLSLLDEDQRGAWEIAWEYGSAMNTGLLGVVDIVGCCTVDMTGVGVCSCGPWAMPGQAHWQLASPRPFLQPIPAKGALGLWSLSPEQRRQVGLRLPDLAGAS